MIVTRFPPEPNGYLHLGHLKSIYLNFNYPKDNGGGICLLRFDDTNPETEKQIFVDKIKETINWLGYEPHKISYTSDYFHKLYNYSLKLINTGLAYVDELTTEEMAILRKENKKSPYRDRTISENLKLFDEMKNGNFKENTKCLRLKIDDNTTSCMNDPIAYRIKYTPHYKTKDEWCIYPSYDFSHCIVDSLENITHSFCTMEFFVRRKLYYWILEKLELKAPEVTEFNRLETDFGILSKRKIKSLIEDKIVVDWEDPLLITLNGLKNKGYSPDILKEFCKKLHYTTNSGGYIEKSLLDHITRSSLSDSAERCFGVLNPLKIIIENISSDEEIALDRPLYPQDPSSELSKIFLKKNIYIEKDDFKLEANKKFFRLTSKQSVRLKYGGIITYVSHEIDSNGNFKHITVNYTSEQKKVKGTIHWTSNDTPKKVYLFDYDDMKKHSYDSYVDDTNNEYLQFERLGYYKKINNNTYHHLCSLKEDKNKHSTKN
ncbi:tRNA synthetases class I (E and Q), catalytic domain [seawater metagenome]|uniref:glutamine--tRNA ligase n=1 Tax=seawater metagenome TaxID=1561972 RepID=A0A5E8CJZ1_9ZZZZ